MWTCDLSPNNPNLRSPDLLLSPIDVRNLLAQVECSRFRVVYAFDLDQAANAVSILYSS